MKIGILTHHWLYNFGANLQALSTVSALEKMGHEPIILNYRIPELVEKYDSMCSAEQRIKHVEFCEKWLPETEVCRNTSEVITAANQHQIEVAISGSDAVLRIDTRSDREDLNFPNPFWLDWTKETNVKRSGFLAASSMGSNFVDLPKASRKKINRAVGRLNFVGIRDRWTEWMLGYCGAKSNIHFCPDPVSVFNDDVDFEDESPSTGSPYILFCSYKNKVSTEWIQTLVDAAHQKGLRVFGLPNPESETNGPLDRVLKLPMSPIEWYRWLRHSAGFVGVRFHPVMISLVNKRPFVALDQYQTGARFRNRYLSKAINLLPGIRRFSSKTNDVSQRAQRENYCLSPKQYLKMGGKKVFELLWSDPQPSPEFSNSANTTFRSALSRICGENGS